MDVVSTGDDELDRILGGGLPAGALIVLAGPPGTGKTIMAQQLVFAAATEERCALYYTTLSEPHSKLLRHLEPFSFFDRGSLGRRVEFLHLTELAQGFDGAGRGLDAVVEEVVEQAFERSPSFVVIDSSKALHHFGDDERMREIIFSLASKVAHTGSVLLLVGEYTPDELETAPEFAVADGIIQLANERYGAVDRRWLRIAKMRGRDFLSGQHTYRITEDGLAFFPRLEAIAAPRAPETSGRHGFGIPVLDEMLNGGLPQGNATLVMGPTGSGKTVLSSHFLTEGVRQGERTLYVTFEETVEELLDKASSLGIELREAVDAGAGEVLFVPPMELEIDEIGGIITQRIDALRPDRVIIDSLGELIPAARRLDRFPSYVWALMSTLREHGASVVFTYEITAMGGGAGDARIDALSYLFHNVLVLRYMERGSELGRVLNVLKMRASLHDTGLLQFRISDNGIQPLGGPGDVEATLGWTVLGSATGEQ